MDIEIRTIWCMALIQKDRTLTRTGTYDIRESGQFKYCTPDTVLPTRFPSFTYSRPA